MSSSSRKTAKGNGNQGESKPRLLISSRTSPRGRMSRVLSWLYWIASGLNKDIYDHSDSLSYLERAIHCVSVSLDNLSDVADGTGRLDATVLLAINLCNRYTKLGLRTDIEQALTLLETAINEFPQGSRRIRRYAVRHQIPLSIHISLTCDVCLSSGQVYPRGQL